MKKVGLIVNPWAGIGGKVGLKGSDGLARKAAELGGRSEAASRVAIALKELKDSPCTWFTWAGDMGEDALRAAGYVPETLGAAHRIPSQREDTLAAAAAMKAAGLDLLLFAGGDGTARDIYTVIGDSLPVIGIPAGVKIHSPVYAVNPRRAGAAAAAYLRHPDPPLVLKEVMDIDEESFRAGRVMSALYGHMRVPENPVHIQRGKAGGFHRTDDLRGIAAALRDMLDDETLYILGPGSTLHGVMAALGIEKGLLSVDLLRQGKIIAADVGESDILAALQGGQAKIIVTVIGGQGHLFGRGNQQISPAVIKAVGVENILVIATLEKLIALKGAPLLVDSGDPSLDAVLSRPYRIVTGYHRYMMAKASS